VRAARQLFICLGRPQWRGSGGSGANGTQPLIADMIRTARVYGDLMFGYSIYLKNTSFTRRKESSNAKRKWD